MLQCLALSIMSALLLGSTDALAQEWPVEAQEQMLVRGQNAQLTVKASTVAKKLSARGLDSSGWSISKEGTKWILQEREIDSRGEIKSRLQNPPRAVAIELFVPATMHLEVHLRDGQVQLNGRKSDTRVTLRNGRLVATGQAGPLRASVQKGEVQVTDASGRLDLDVFDGGAQLKNVKADLDVRMNRGQMQCDSCKGNLRLTLWQASARLAQCSGTLSLENGKGTVTLTGFQGRIEGQNQEGTIMAQILADSDVQLTSTAGKVQILVPAKIGSYLQLRSERGDIVGPKELKVNRSATEKSLKARWNGEPTRITVNVQSTEGSIVVK